MKLTKKEKDFLSHLFNKTLLQKSFMIKEEKDYLRHLFSMYTLLALSSSYRNDDEKSFKEDFGVSFEFAEKALDKLRNELSK